MIKLATTKMSSNFIKQMKLLSIKRGKPMTKVSEDLANNEEVWEFLEKNAKKKTGFEVKF